MKAEIDDAVEVTAPVASEFSDEVFPAGTRGVVVECYEDPEGYSVDLAIPAPHLVGECRYENVILEPSQFRIVRR